ncbi:MAG: DUF3311 domain-containing protein [Gemmatimonadota bacterium]
MTVRFVRGLTLAFVLAYVIALTYPGAVPFNRIRPFVLGLPFSFFWVALWVAAAIGVFWLLDRVETTEEAGRSGGADGGEAAVGADDGLGVPPTGGPRSGRDVELGHRRRGG